MPRTEMPRTVMPLTGMPLTGMRENGRKAHRTAKRVLLASPRGYCAGVDRAVLAVEKALETHGAPVYVRKEIVHNRHVVETLAERGAVFVDEADEVPGARSWCSPRTASPRRCTRGPPRAGCSTIDATCPLVTKVHQEVKRFARDGYDILLVGHQGHEEVEGTAGEAPDHVQLVDGPADVAAVRGPGSGEGGVAVPDDAVG